MAGPLHQEQVILYAEIDPQQAAIARRTFDVAGHYARPDVFTLQVDRRSLRRYVKFTGREKDLAVSFNSYQLNKRVSYDVDTDTLSIEGVPSALRKQLLEHLKG